MNFFWVARRQFSIIFFLVYSCVERAKKAEEQDDKYRGLDNPYHTRDDPNKAIRSRTTEVSETNDNSTASQPIGGLNDHQTKPSQARNDNARAITRNRSNRSSPHADIPIVIKVPVVRHVVVARVPGPAGQQRIIPRGVQLVVVHDPGLIRVPVHAELAVVGREGVQRVSCQVDAHALLLLLLLLRRGRSCCRRRRGK